MKHSGRRMGRRRNLRALIAGTVGLVLSGKAAATIIVDQPPHPFGGPTSDTSFYLFPGFPYSQRLADDFVLSIAEQVVSLTWWGFYNEDNPPTEETMRVRIYRARDDGLPNENGIVSETTIENPSRTATGRRIQTGVLPREYLYEAELTSPASLDANTKYWLEVVQIGDIDTKFRWETSVAGNGEFAFINPQVADWRLDTVEGDLAFQLIVPEPESLLLAFFGLLVFAKLARRKKRA